MSNRREFLQSGIALSMLSLPVFADGTTTSERSGSRLALERFVFDDRFAEAAEAARHAAGRGVRLTPFSGDLTQLWYDDLDLRWKSRPMALAGVTTWHSLFVLETLAADRRMRVVYRGEHAIPAEGRLSHSLWGPSPVVEGVLASSGACWAGFAHAMTLCPAERIAPVKREVTTGAAAGTTRTEALYSWIIAPRSPAAPRI